MTAARKYLDVLKEREPQLWKEPLEESGFTEKDLSEIKLPQAYPVRLKIHSQKLWRKTVWIQ